ncbi:unnamed protein product [Scytosiphon promiscuus]
MQLVGVFLEVTHSSDEAQGAQMLEWYNWEVERAVSAFMLGDITPPRSFLMGNANNASMNGAGTAPGALSVIVGLPFRLLGKVGAARRRSGGGIAAPVPLFVVRFCVAAGGVISYALSPVNYILGVEDQPKDGSAAARRFVNQFETEYGQERRPTFVAESYPEAVQEAARQHKFLMVYLHSPLHQDTPEFCRSTLCSAAMVDFMEHNVLVWGGSLMHGEALAVGNDLDACAFPYVGLLLCKQNQVQVVERVEGAEGTETLLDRLTSAMERFQEQLDRIHRQQKEREDARRLREEQDNDYRKGLEADRRRSEAQQEERRAKERAAEEERARAEEEAAKLAREEQTRIEHLESIRSRVREEPPPGGNTARIRLQLPNGSKVERRFDGDGTVGEIRGFVTLYLEDNDIPIKNFSMSTNFPRKTYSQEDGDDALSVVEAGLHPTAMLFVHDLDA